MKLNDELITSFCKDIQDGLPIQYACDMHGITRMSYLNWMDRGEKDRDEAEACADGSSADGSSEAEMSIYAKFFAGVKKAYATFVRDAKDAIRSGKQGWQGSAWWLERTNKDFMPKQQIQADEDGKVTVVIGGKPKDTKPYSPHNKATADHSKA